MKQEWLLCDLHLHSEYSKINKPSESSRVKKMLAEDFVKNLADKKVKVFSITDHNYFSKKFYDENEKYIVENNLSMKIINGTELDAYVILTDGSMDYIHICIYFEAKVDRQQLEVKINELYKDENGNELKPLFTDIINKLYDLKCKFIVIPHGNKDRGIFNIIKNLSPNETVEFYKYAMYKIFSAFDVRPKFYGASENFWATNFFENSKAFKLLIDQKTETELKKIESNISNKIKNQESLLTEEEVKIYDYILQYGSYFAYFAFSDWHNAENYNPKINNFIFGSLETAYESFEMATLDPISRIEQSADTEIEIPSTILENVSFKIDDKEHKILFSPGLNAVVGKRGSGKSLLLAVIKNLVDKDDSDGAIKKYKSLKISEIKGENRGNIKISMGGLSSIAFLTQDEIKEIFEDPRRAQDSIANNFIEIKDIDLLEIQKIIDIGKNISPYNENYKNLTSNILSIKKLTDYNYNYYKELIDTDIKLSFTNAINSLNLLSKNLDLQSLNTIYVANEIERINSLSVYYLKLIELYNHIISKNNNIIYEINSKKSSNQITVRQNIINIQNSLNELKNNFVIQLNIEKLKILLQNFEINNPPVELYQKGNYLFVTYYEIPENIKEIIENKILETITRSNNFDDVYKYANGDESKKLKASYSNITDELNKYLKDDIFKSRKEFYEIKDKSLKYKDIIRNMNDLREQTMANNIINLTNASPGMKSVAYLDMLFDLDETILILDQPEDNIDNDYISNYLVPNIKNKKKIKQLIFVTHNPSVAVYGDAFNYIYAENSEEIKYTNYLIEKNDDKERLIKILEGGRPSFSNRNKKFGDVLGEEEYANN